MGDCWWIKTSGHLPGYPNSVPFDSLCGKKKMIILMQLAFIAEIKWSHHRCEPKDVLQRGRVAYNNIPLLIEAMCFLLAVLVLLYSILYFIFIFIFLKDMLHYFLQGLMWILFSFYLFSLWLNNNYF
jgi:hypothetical protein